MATQWWEKASWEQMQRWEKSMEMLVELRSWRYLRIEQNCIKLIIIACYDCRHDRHRHRRTKLFTHNCKKSLKKGNRLWREYVWGKNRKQKTSWNQPKSFRREHSRLAPVRLSCIFRLLQSHMSPHLVDAQKPRSKIFVNSSCSVHLPLAFFFCLFDGWFEL